MARKTGYLASIFNIPPLIFRFQFNPALLSEKKAFKYDPANSFGKWGFDQTSAASGVLKSAIGIYQDIEEIGSLLIGVKPLEPVEGDPRSFELEFALDSTTPGPLDKDDHYGGSIKPDLALLRSFMVPTWTAGDLLKTIAAKKWVCFTSPPPCTLNYGGINAECVMTDLNIKHVLFQDNGDPSRAEVTCTLKEQSFSLDPVIGTVTRLIDVARSYNRAGIGTDFVANTPIVGAFK
jgi:hypothetical protein